MNRLMVACRYDVQFTDFTSEDSFEEFITYLDDAGYENYILKQTEDGCLFDLERSVIEDVADDEGLPRKVRKLAEILLDRSDPDSYVIHLEVGYADCEDSTTSN